MNNAITNPRDALVYIDFVSTFSDDASTVAQWRGIGKVIRSLMKKAEKAALHMERQEAAVEKAGKCDVVELLRGIQTVMASRPDGQVFVDVCKQAADEIDSLRWELRDAK